MDVPSSSGISKSTGSHVSRRKRNLQNVIDDDDEDDNPFVAPKTSARKVRGNTSNPFAVVSTSVMDKVATHCDDIVNKKAVGALNCFDYKSPLELYGIEKMIEANASIQEMAAVVDSAQAVLAYRVDRLYHDVRQVDSAFAGGDFVRGTGSDSIHLNVENRKAKKKLAITDGMNGMSDFLNQIDDEPYVEQMRRQIENNPEAQPDQDEDNNNAGERELDVTANSKDVDFFLQDTNGEYDKLLDSIAIERGVNFRGHVQDNASAYVTADDTAHDLKDSTIDWLKTNPTFQKATKGFLNNSNTSFHCLNHYGVHSEDGRALILHPRIHDNNANDTFFVDDAKPSLVNNTRCLLENALSSKPVVITNYLMLEVRDRPVIRKINIAPKEVKRNGLPLAESARQKELACLTFAEANRAADQTIAGSSDLSMHPARLPLSVGDNEPETDDEQPDTTNQTVVAGQPKVIDDEYIPLPLEAIDMDEALVGKVPMDPLEMDELKKIFENKIREFNESDDVEAKAWRNGMRADEWGPDDEASMRAMARGITANGIDSWFKASNSWTNSDVVKMPINRETRMALDDTAHEEADAYRHFVPDIGKNLFLVASDEYLNNYPGDRYQDFKMVDEEADIMTLIPGPGEEENAVTDEQIRMEIQKRQEKANHIDQLDDTDFDAAAVEVEFDDRLAAPADDDDFVAQRQPQNNDDPHVADILFQEQLEEREDDAANDHVRMRNVEDIAIGAEEVPELMTAVPPEQTVGQSAEMRDEIRNIGKNDNAHWLPPEVAEERQEAIMAQRKKKSNRTKSKKVTVDEYVHYFRDIFEDEVEREVTAARCEKVSDEKNTFLTEGQVYMPTLGTENKPHVAMDLTLLFSSGLYFKKPYGKLKLARVKPGTDEALEAFTEESKAGNKESDCLNWLLSFGGFRCVENPEPVENINENDKEAEQAPQLFTGDEDDIGNFDDEYDRYNPRYDQELAAASMGPEYQRRLAELKFNLNSMDFARYGEFDNSDDEFEDAFDRQTISAKNLDAAKHKKCLTDILNNDTLSMPCIQYALEQLNLKKDETLRQNNTTVRGANTSQRDRTESPVPHDNDTTLTTVFEYHSPNKMNHDFNEILAALADMPDYIEDERGGPNPDQSDYETARANSRKLKIKGLHTLLSLALTMPSKMGENVKPSSIVSFILHVANENNLRIVQDRSKRSWMSDFVVLHHADDLPRGLKMGKIDETTDFWRRTQDPDAVEGSQADLAPMFANLIKTAPRPKAVPVRKGQRGGAQRDLRAISEEEEEDEEEMES